MTSFFIADLHLQDECPELTRAFLHFVDQKVMGADALYILGDLFEAWIGNDDDSETNAQVVKSLKQLSDSGVDVYLQQGNRDFLIDQGFAQRCGATLLSETCLITPYQQSLLIMHGDQLCLDDTEYQEFKTLTRSTEWRNDFLSKPLTERQAIAAHLRQQSKQSGQQKSQAIMDVSPAEVKNVMARHEVDILIHGHTHRPDIHTLSGNKYRIVLGDWDKYLWYLEWQNNDNHQLRKAPIKF